MKKSKIIVPALGILVLSTAAAVTGTVAWFTASNVININGLQMRVEAEDGIEFKVVANVNYGDVKLYKCTGELYGEQIVVYLNKEREIELGSTVKLVPALEKTEIYEDELNIRLY